MKNAVHFAPSLPHNIKIQHFNSNPTKSGACLLRNNDERGASKGLKKIWKKLVSISSQNMEKQIQIYNWRGKTQLPVAKVFCYKIIPCFTVKNKTMLQVSYEAPILRLSDINRLPLYQIIYLMKQSLIGFERLINYIGPFEVNDRQIFINKSHKCKVWWNEEFAQNSLPIVNRQIDEYTFLSQVARIFEEHTIQSKNSLQLFSDMKKISRLVEAISWIDRFSKQHKIIISASLDLSSSLSKNSPSKMTSSKYYQSGETTESFINSKKNIFPDSSFSKLQSSMFCRTQSQISPSQKINSPKFLSKKSFQDTAMPLSNPETMDKSFLNKSKSYHYFKNLKQSTFTKLNKSKYEIDTSSYDGSNSQITTKSTKVVEKVSLQQNHWLNKTPKNKKQKKDFSFKRDSPQKNKNMNAGGQQTFEKSSSQIRLRKYSNDITLTKKLPHQYEYKGIKILSPVPIKQQIKQDSKNVSVESSIEANKEATAESTSKKQLNIPSNVSSILNIFQRNGWKMQLQTLTDNKKSIRQSIKDGKQERSKFLGSTIDFAKLARFGRTIQGSMTPADQFEDS